MKTPMTLASLLLSISISINAAQVDINAIEQAGMTLNIATLTQLVDNNTGYENALANYRLSIAYNLTNKTDQAIATIEESISRLKALVKEEPKNSEYWALLAQSYGLKISYQPIKAAYYGPKSASALSKALSFNPENPRAHLVNAISKYNTPAMFGGSKSQALIEVKKAIDLFKQETNNELNSIIHWGEAEAHIWRGLIHISLNKQPQALMDFETALTIEPSYDWAKMLITQNKQ
jgi:tetratricopeptide (TPR) repeat protein